jgi:hypothetical protein
MRHRTLAILLAAALLPVVASAQTRPFAMGFSDTTYDQPQVSTPNGPWAQTWASLHDIGDLVVIHEDGLVPWQQAFEFEFDEYPDDYKEEIAFRATQRALLPSTHKVVLYVNLANFDRNGVAQHRGDLSRPLENDPNGWAQRSFDDPTVIAAFINHVSYLITMYDPDYVSYGIESNVIYHKVLFENLDPEVWDDFKTAAHEIYDTLKGPTYFPDKKFFFSIQGDFFNAFETAHRAALACLMDATDIIAVSGYPYTLPNPPTASAVPADYLFKAATLDISKPFAIAETGWPAETVSQSAAPADIPSTEYDQFVWVWKVLDTAYAQSYKPEPVQVLFVNWFVARDYDALYTHLQNLAAATPDPADDAQVLVFRYWRDTGLLDQNNAVRLGFGVWYNYLALDRCMPGECP